MAEERESLFKGACPERIAELEKFVASGEATSELFDHIDACAACAAVVERIFKTQSAGLEDLGRLIRQVRGPDIEVEQEPRASPAADRVLKALLAVTAAASLLLVAEAVVQVYGGERDQQLSRSARARVEVLFPGLLDRSCAADPATLCHFGRETAACAAADRYVWLPFPAPTKVLCQFNTWPKPDPVYGAAFIIIDGPDIVSYRYPNCPGGGVLAAITVEGGQSRVRQFPEAGTAADECGAGPRIEVDRWRAR